MTPPRAAPALLPLWALLLAGAIAFSAGCSKTAPAGIESLAVFPLENQTGDSSLDWMERASVEVIGDQLAGSQRFRVSTAYYDRAQAAAAGVKWFLAGYFAVEKGRLRLHCWLQQGASGKISDVFSTEGALPGGLLAALDRAAHQLDPAARPYATTSEQAFRAYVDARQSTDAPAAVQGFERAVKLDPGFGPAYLAWGQSAAARRDPQEFERIAGLARAAGARLRPADRIALDLQQATLRNDPEARARALTEMARERPNDPDVIRSSAESDMMAHRFEQGAASYRKAAALVPSNPVVWNELGYAEALAGRLDAALEALRRYQALSPQQANPLDSIGDVYYNAGRLAEAEKAYREAYGKEPAGLGANSLAKASLARLASGDIAGADTLCNEYLAVRKQARDPSVEFRRAQWLHLSGRRREGQEQMEALARGGSGPVLAAQANAQLALWLLIENKRDAAASRAAAAGDFPLAQVMRFLVQPPASASEWAVRGERVFADPKMEPMKQYAVGYALLLAREFAAAAPLWKQIHTRANLRAPDDSAWLLAWALIETNRWDGVENLIRPNGFPQPAGSPFASLAFPRIFDLRARLAVKQGRASDAASNRRLYGLLSGQGQ